MNNKDKNKHDGSCANRCKSAIHSLSFRLYILLQIHIKKNRNEVTGQRVQTNHSIANV